METVLIACRFASPVFLIACLFLMAPIELLRCRGKYAPVHDTDRCDAVDNEPLTLAFIMIKKRNSYLVPICFVSLLLMGSCSAFLEVLPASEVETLTQDFFKNEEVVSGWRNLETAVENCSGTYVRKLVEESGKSTIIEERKFSKRGNSTKSEVWMRGEAETLVPYRLICSNPRYFFGLRSTLGDGDANPWKITDVQLQVPNPKWNYVVQLERDSGVLGFIRAPYAVMGFPLYELLEDETFVFSNVRFVDSDQKIIATDFSWKIPEDLAMPPGAGPGLNISGFIEFNSQESWRVERFGVRMSKSNDSKDFMYFDVYLEYSKTDEGIPYVSKILRCPSNVGYGEKCNTMIVDEVFDIDFTPVPDSEFTLSHYGFPEPEFGEPKMGWFRIFLMTIGGLMVVYALWRLYRNRKGGITNG